MRNCRENSETFDHSLEKYIKGDTILKVTDLQMQEEMSLCQYEKHVKRQPQDVVARNE